MIRRFESLAHRQQLEETYYASADWRQGPREAIMALIETYTDIVYEVDDATVEGLRKPG